MEPLDRVPRLPPEVQNVAGFFVILAASIAGYSGLGAWSIALAALGLLTLSYFERQRLIGRTYELGATALAERAWIGSLVNAVCATGAAYAFGVFLGLI